MQGARRRPWGLPRPSRATPQTPLFLTTRRDRADFPSCGVVASLLGHYPTASAPPCLRGNLPRSRPRETLRQAPSHRHAWIAAAALLLAACASQMEPAQRSISDIEAALSSAASDAAKYVPDQLTDVRRELGDLKAMFDRQDYAGVLKAAPAVMERAQGLASQAKAKKADLTQALGEEWSGLSARLPGLMTTS